MHNKLRDYNSDLINPMGVLINDNLWTMDHEAGQLYKKSELTC